MPNTNKSSNPMTILASEENINNNKSVEMKKALKKTKTKILNIQDIEVDDMWNDSFESLYDRDPISEFMPFAKDKDAYTFVGYWDVPMKSILSKNGKKIISQDPNLSKNTLEMLLETEESMCKHNAFQRALNEDRQKLVNEEFYDNNACGFAHLALCVKECIGKSFAELIDVFAEERDIPFILAALYIIALRDIEGLSWIKFDSTRGYLKVNWEPANIVVIPVTALPPRIARKLETPNYKDPMASQLPVPALHACPLCHSPAVLSKTGQKNKKWHVCCSDEENKCFLSFGIPGSESPTPRQAAEIWNTLSLEKS